jgi:cation diffusion facilitator family transporter
MKFIRKLLVKDYKNVSDAAVRTRYGVAAGIFGLISNALLFAGKLAVGIAGGSITVIADAVNNLSDMGSGAVTLAGFKIASRPADKEHPFGHARFEYIAGLIVAFAVLSIGVLLLKDSIEKIIIPKAVAVGVYTYAVLGCAIALKIVQALVYGDFAKAVKSLALKSSAADSRNDAIATCAVLVSAIVIDKTGVNIDGYMGVAVSLFIIISGALLVKSSINPILGEKSDPELVKKIREKILSYDGVRGMHDLVIHNYGAANCFVIAHVEVSADVDVMISHDIIDNIEHDFQTEMGIKLNIHMDPVDTDDKELESLKQRVLAVLERMDTSLTLHDFRRVRGDSHTNILFDVVVPYDCPLKLDAIKSAVEKEFANDKTKYYFVIEMDR